MENEFAKTMSERTDEELVKIVTAERDKYNPIAIEAAESEIAKRNIDTNKFEEIKEKTTKERIEKDKVDSKVVGSGIRFLNLIIDSIIWYILIVITYFLFWIIIPTSVSTSNGFIVGIINLVIIFVPFFAYHSLMEIKFQKTIGKFITKTRVVKLNGEKPESADIISRTFCRLIPFDRISFLFMKNGIHDFLSKTKVIKDKSE
ncbi:putative RDD family membrane protein YckC [Cellulophaga sp. RHA19]|uniref:RDD family protein n=1 Tax=Cellulophaga sp. RHA19 TaxID=1798237 RepID=UPI000C2C4F80|nr:RDD family protein [Cellulophaga sp. RHA19]PKB42196.1 putative RDD family membrane protein YckC [Cellulophaga sp. RHA19]